MLDDYEALIAGGEVMGRLRRDRPGRSPGPGYGSRSSAGGDLAVARDRQGTGLGSTLLTFAEQQARAQGLPEVRLYTNEEMTENLSYYPRRGFVESHRSGDSGYRRVFFSKQVRP